MHTIALCEDNPLDSANLQNILDDYEHNMRENFNVRAFTDAETLLAQVQTGNFRPEVLFMDIALPGISGLDAVRTLRAEGFSGEVIFTTSSPSYALTAYELCARQYFVKPITPQRVFAALEQVLSSRDYIVVRNRRNLRKIKCSDILYCETQGKYQIIHTRIEEITARLSAHSMKILVPPSVNLPP